MQRASTNIPTTLQGKIVCITGTMRMTSRDDLKAALIAAGAHVSGSVNKHTDLLVAGTIGPGSKLEKAKELGIPVIGEEIVQMLLDGKFLPNDRLFRPSHEPFSNRSSAEQAIANVLAMVMLELGVEKLTIGNPNRTAVMTGNYMVAIAEDEAFDGVTIKLIDLNKKNEGAGDAAV